MNLSELIQPDSVLCNVTARSKKHCLEVLSELLTRPNPDVAHEEVFANLIERERLGCTCLDKGIAFPRCRIGGLSEPSAAVMRLSEPIDFDAANGEFVDLIFGLMVPEELDQTDIDAIEKMSRQLRSPDLAARLREANSSSELCTALQHSLSSIEADIAETTVAEDPQHSDAG